MQNFVIKPWMWITGAVVVVTLFIGISLFSTLNGIQTEGVAFEARLSAQYLDNQNELSSYISSFYEQVGVANLKSDKMDQILLDAVKGRYDNNSSAQPDRGKLFSAIKEAYPNIDGLNIYDKIIDFVRAGREAYKQKQSKLLDMLGQYDTWRESGLVHSQLVKMMGYPSKALHANIGSNVTYGADAEAQMYVIVTTKEGQQAYQTGTQAPLQIPGGGVNRGSNAPAKQ